MTHISTVLQNNAAYIVFIPCGAEIRISLENYAKSTIADNLAPVPLKIFRSNLKLDQNLHRLVQNVLHRSQRSFAYDGVTVVMRAKYRCDRLSIFNRISNSIEIPLMGRTFKYVWYFSVEKWQKIQMNFIFLKINSTRRELTSNSTLFTPMTLQWCHNERDSVSNHQPNDCLLNRLFGRRSKKTSKPRVTGLCVGNSPVTGEFPAQMASNAENVSIWWRHHGKCVLLGIRKKHTYTKTERWVFKLSILFYWNIWVISRSNNK